MEKGSPVAVALFCEGGFEADDYRVEMAVALIGERNFVVAEGTDLSLKLGNGEVEVFKAAQPATPVS